MTEYFTYFLQENIYTLWKNCYVLQLELYEDYNARPLTLNWITLHLCDC